MSMGDRENSPVFRPGKIGTVAIKNRLIRAATGDRSNNEKGEVTEYTINTYRNQAKGGVGAIITGHVAPLPKGYPNPTMTRFHDDAFIPGVRKIARAVHEHRNDCRVFLQLGHAGRQIRSPSDQEPVAPSPNINKNIRAMGEILKDPRPLRPEEIEEIIEGFSEAVRRARDAEFDGVELHAAHGWLLSSFLSPHTNRREDEYGGSTENRVRIVKEIYERGRKKAGDDFPILIKINTEDSIPGGVDIPEAARIGERLYKIGFDAVETSGGMWEALSRPEEELGWKPVTLPEARIDIQAEEKQFYNLPGAREIKKRTDVPLILIGGVRSVRRIEEILTNGWADFFSMCRPFIREPDLPDRWLRGEGPEHATCISCNKCIHRPDPPIRGWECLA